MAIKVDMAKAFDRMEWQPILKVIPLSLGFHKFSLARFTLAYLLLLFPFF